MIIRFLWIVACDCCDCSQMAYPHSHTIIRHSHLSFLPDPRCLSDGDLTRLPFGKLWWPHFWLLYHESHLVTQDTLPFLTRVLVALHKSAKHESAHACNQLWCYRGPKFKAKYNWTQLEQLHFWIRVPFFIASTGSSVIKNLRPHGNAGLERSGWIRCKDVMEHAHKVTEDRGWDPTIAERLLYHLKSLLPQHSNRTS